MQKKGNDMKKNLKLVAIMLIICLTSLPLPAQVMAETIPASLGNVTVSRGNGPTRLYSNTSAFTPPFYNKANDPFTQLSAEFVSYQGSAGVFAETATSWPQLRWVGWSSPAAAAAAISYTEPLFNVRWTVTPKSYMTGENVVSYRGTSTSPRNFYAPNIYTLNYELWSRADGTYEYIIRWFENGNLLEEVRNVSDVWNSNPTVSIRVGTVGYVEPAVVGHPNLVASLESSINWCEGIAATWGHTTTNTIPNLGEITDLSLTGGTDPLLSSTGATYDQVGHRQHDYRIKDSHSLNTTDPQYAGDNTYTDTNRWITVKTEELLEFEAYLNGSGSNNGDTYNGSYWLSPNGTTADAERRYGVDLKAQTDTPGEYDFTIKKTGVTTPIVSQHYENFLPTSITTTAEHLNYVTDTGSTGDSFISVLVAHKNPAWNPAIPLSPETAPKVVKIDSQAPPAPTVTTPGGVDKWSTITPSSTDNGASGVPTVHQDGYYYKFVPAGTPSTSPLLAQPSGSDSGWTSVALYEKPTESGDYDLYVYAKDNATNRSPLTQANPVGEPIKIESEVLVKKTTTTGATLHSEGCTDWDKIDIGGNCEGDCVDGTHKEIMQDSTLTYKLEFENTDTTKTANGSFVDYLPEGIDTNLANEPTFTLGTGVTNVTAVVDGGRWKVTGDYTLSAEGKSDITISTKAPLLKDVPGTSKVISNQAEITYEIGTGVGAITDSAKSNYANHRINEVAKISKSANNEAAIHAHDCPNSTSLEVIAGCEGSCVAGNTGLVEEGYVMTYKLNFENPSNTIQYFATDTARFYDQMPAGVSIAGQDWSVELTGNGTFSESDTTPATGKGSVSPWSDANGNSLTGLSFDATNNGVVQDGNTSISLAPGAKLEITVKAKVTDAGSDSLVNQVKSGYKLDGNNNAALTTSDAEVIAINSNYTTHERAIFGVDTKFTKVGADDLDAPLAGAEFALYKWTDTESAYVSHEDDILDVTLPNGGEASNKWLRATTDGADGTTSDVFTTLADGEIDLGKLPDGIYTLIETKAPDGYELPVGQWVLTINNSKGNTTDGDYQIEYSAKGEMLPPATIRTAGASAGDAPTYKVVNVRSFSIGMSGMNGTKGITILGLTIMLIAGISYSIYNLKKSKTSRKK